MKRRASAVCCLAAAAAFGWVGPPAADSTTTVTVGCKHFNESYILAEIIAQFLETAGYAVERNFGMGGTMVCYQALVNGEIDVYPEYSGTVAQAILKIPEEVSYRKLKRVVLDDTPLEMLDTFGFNNTYAIAVGPEQARRLGVRTIGDLARHPELTVAFSYEFLNRNDGWPGLKQAYGLPQEPAGIEHGLAYQAIEEGKIDVTDVYTTDGDIERYGLYLLEDDRGYFPQYLAVPLVRAGLDAGVKAVLGKLAGRIGEDQMRELNASVVLGGNTFAEAAAGFLQRAGLAGAGDSAPGAGRWDLLLGRTLRHIELTLIALVASMLVAIPAGVAVYQSQRHARAVIYVAGALQTIPSIAMLAFMIPLFGIGVLPAIAALFLYALLPILRNTATALFSIEPVLKKVAVGMGLTRWQRMRYVEIPLATPTILAGVKTAAVINIGTATLAAFIGAGGLGEPIVTGLALNDTSLILEGAVPAAVLAIITELAFEAIERFAIPRHLRQELAG